MTRIHQKSSTVNLTDLSEINIINSIETLTYQEAFHIVKDYVQLASAKPYTDISITCTYLDILRVFEKVETRIEK